MTEPADPRTSAWVRWSARVRSLRVRLTLTVAVLLVAGLTAGGAWLVHAVDATVIRVVEEEHRVGLHEVTGPSFENGATQRPMHRRVVVRADGVTQEEHWIGPPGGVDDDPLAVEMPHPTSGALPKLMVNSPVDEIRRGSDRLKRALVFGTSAAVVLLTLAAWILIGRTLQPVRSMTQSAARIANATVAERLVVPETFDEVAELAHTLNGMLDRLAVGARRQREFVSDASHELRSPVTAIRTQLEVALAHPDRLEAEAAMRGVLVETSRLEALVADLLALARLDEEHSLAREEVDLDDIVLEERSRTRARALPIDIRRVSGVKVYGDRRSLSHLVRNLLDNAVTHAGSMVAVSTFLDDGKPVLWVDDDGPGVPEADRGRIFERFTRLSSGRSRDWGGAGLGLALVRRIAEQHGGVVRADRSPQGGARFEVRFRPLSDRRI
jgi:signal transduction histidine kinase